MRLQDVCVSMSSNIAQKDIKDCIGNYPIYGASGLIGNVDYYKQEVPYIGIVKDGAGVGRVYILPAKSSVIGTMQYIIPNNNIDLNYLYYALQHMHLEKYSTGATIPHIYFRDYQFEPISLPTLHEQRRKSSILQHIDKMISIRSMQVEIMDTLVKSRFVEMFGDPVMNSKGYPVYKLSDITTSRLGKMLDKKRQTGKNKYPYLANYNVQWFRLELDNLNEMDFDEADRQEFELRNGDLLVCEGGEVGRCAIWRGEKENCYFQKALHRVRCDPKYIIPEYLGWTFYWHSQYNGFIDAISGVSTIAHLPGDKLKQLQIIVPPLDIQNQFADFVALTDKSKLTVQQSISTLQTLKNKLMQDYFG